MRKKGEKAKMLISRTGTCHKGLTLLELLVVIFIVSLMLALSFPSFRFQTDEKLKSEAVRIASILRYLNDSAISTKEACAMKMIFKDRSMHYKVPDGEKKETFAALSAISLQSRGKVSIGEVAVIFSPTGAGESFAIHLADERSRMTVFFNALSGRVKVTADEAV
jgi:prepilin-type N-terminal cleavage/methylation domain-containing protein